LQKLALRRPDLSEASDGSVGKGHRPRELRDELLHGLADPEGGVRPERRVQPGGVTLRGDEEADDSLLAELLTLDARAGGEAPAETGDGGHEDLDQLAARIGVTGCGRYDKSPFLPRGERFGVAHRT